MLSAAPATDPTLAQWLRMLWDCSPGLHLGSDVPFIAGGEIHLPMHTLWHEHCAAAAHAAAHLVFSPPRFEAEGLVPVSRTLLALLEDARVEALAIRELPGLARLWQAWHRATPEDGDGLEPLLGRLARALADPDYVDNHPWIGKGRRLFFIQGPDGLRVLRTPSELRTAAMRLGHDVGQMRLPFNAKGYRPMPAYRDDHRWMWAAGSLTAAAPPQVAPVADDSSLAPDDDDDEAVDAGHVTLHPEWDRLITRLRPNWCSVTEHVGAQPTPPAASLTERLPHPDALSRQLLGPLRSLVRRTPARRRCHDGETFDTDALLAWCIASRQRRAADARVYRGSQHQAGRCSVWLLVDRSASTALPLGATGSSVLQAAARSAAAIALALQTLGVRCAISAFSSSGRQAVRLVTVKRFGQPVDASLLDRLQALRSGGSTRLGAVLRHASARHGLNGADPGARRWVLLLSDSQPHDIDIHDPRYLVDDARHAVHEAHRRAVRMCCIHLAERAGPAALRIFGLRGVQSLADPAGLPRALQRLQT